MTTDQEANSPHTGEICAPPLLEQLMDADDRHRARLAHVAREWDALERFATYDPDVDWPSDKHTSAADALMAAFDNLRESRA